MEARSRGGVPVFIRPISKPSPFRDCGQLQRGDLAGPARRIMDVADVDEPAEEGPRRDDHRPAAVEDAGLIDDAADPAVLHDEALHQTLPQVEPLFPLHDGLHGEAVALLVALEAGGLDGRSFGGVQETEVDGGLVGDPAHLAAQGVDLLDELALGEPPDRGVAGHERDGVEIDVEQERLAAHPRRGEGRLAARVPPPTTMTSYSRSRSTSRASPIADDGLSFSSLAVL